MENMYSDSSQSEYIRGEFADWLEDIASELLEEKKESDPKRKYYVYALCERKEDGSLNPFYIGKGTGDRVWNHADETEKEKKELYEEAEKYGYTPDEIKLLEETISTKHKKIRELTKDGKDGLAQIVIKTGLTEYESFMCESALINMFRLPQLSFLKEDSLTNKVNGHSNYFEKHAGIRTSALPVEEYYREYCKEPIIINHMTDEQKNDFRNGDVVFININGYYSDCVNPKLFPSKEEQDVAIREAVRGFWKMSPSRNNNYVFAMVNGRIKGVYKIKKNHDLNEEISYSSFDLWRDDYPRFFKLPGREDEYNLMKSIYSDLLSQGILVEGIPAFDTNKSIQKELFSQLSTTTRDIIKQSVIDEWLNEIKEKKRKKRDKGFIFPDENKSRESLFMDCYKNWLKNKRNDYKKKYKEWLEGKTKNKPEFCGDDFEADEEDFLNDRLYKMSLRRYVVLENIDIEIDPDFSKYMNCSVKLKKKKIPDDIKKKKDTPFDQNPVTYLSGIFKKYKVSVENDDYSSDDDINGDS